MNIKTYLTSLAVCALLMLSCSRDNDPQNPVSPPAPIAPAQADAVNDFVWKAMNSWYYWQPNVPRLADSFKNSTEYIPFINPKTPDGLFHSLLYDYGNIDRFSWIENNNTLFVLPALPKLKKAPVSTTLFTRKTTVIPLMLHW